jgi:seryl-tRNA synthetase
LPHREILEERNLLDSQRAVKISGSRFIMMRDGLARLEMALVMRAINKLNSKGFSFTLVPTIVKKEAMFSTGYLPYGEESIYKVINEDGEQMYLVGTAEVPLVAQHSDETIDLEKLPLRYVAYSHCYR